jgi:hypothetical protein
MGLIAESLIFPKSLENFLPLQQNTQPTFHNFTMRGKRSKQYRKLMQQYGLSFGFREPYQVLMDADIIRDADRFKMDLVGGLERTLHGQVKPSTLHTDCHGQQR